jgi:hypothetical protein
MHKASRDRECLQLLEKVLVYPKRGSAKLVIDNATHHTSSTCFVLIPPKLPPSQT